ncbi:MAG: TonB family protein [Candidatus Acidiferrales bacterium]
MNSPENSAGRFLWRSIFLALLICFAGSIVARSTDTQDLYDFDSLASEVAAAIDKHSTGTSGSTVLVADFEEISDPDSQLAPAFAESFARSLRSHAHNFTVLDRTDIENAVANHKLPVGALSSREVISCYAPDLGATSIIQAWMEYSPDKIVLSLDVSPVQGDAAFFGKTTIIPRTPEMEALKSKRAVFTEAQFGEDKTVWVKDAGTQTKIPAVAYRTPGYSHPDCAYCRQVQYTNGTVRAKISGTLVLTVVIGADGTAQRISVERALPCGLDQQAIEAVKGWRFKPAKDPAGNPAAIVQPVEIAFHLY